MIKTELKVKNDSITLPCNDADIDGIYRYLAWKFERAGFGSDCLHYLEVLIKLSRNQ